MKLSPLNLFTHNNVKIAKEIKYTDVGEKLYQVKSTLENFARHNSYKIKFQPSKEANKIDVLLTDKGFFNSASVQKTIDSNIFTIETTKVNDKLTSDDTFEKRVYRTVDELSSEIEKQYSEIEKEYIHSSYFLHNILHNNNMFTL